MQFKPISSGSSGNCYILEDEGSQIMIEAGIPWKRVQYAMGYKTRDIRFCLCSHFHKDHCGHIKSVMMAGIDCYMNISTAHALQAYDFHRAFVFDAHMPFVVDGWHVRPFECVHDVPTVGFLIARGDYRVLYLSDSRYSPYRFKGLTHILLEINYSPGTMDPNIDPTLKKRIIANHLSLETAKELLSANDLSAVREIWLLHLSNGNSNAEYFKSEIQKLTGIPVMIAGE